MRKLIDFLLVLHNFFNRSYYSGLLYALYGDDLDSILVRKMNVTFGSPEDGFYKKTKYQAWTFTFGVGEPIRNSLSPVLILATIAMMGVLLVVFAVASIICIVR